MSVIQLEVIDMADFGESSYRRFLQGEKDALEELIRTYSDPLIRYAFSYVKNADAAEDIVSDSFAALFTKLRPVRDEEHLRAYLYRTVRNKCIDYFRIANWRISYNELENVIGSCQLEQDQQRKERDRILYLAIASLPFDYRDVLVLTYFDGFSTEQICRVMKKSPKQVYNLHARAKTALRTLLEKEGITHEDL